MKTIEDSNAIILVTEDSRIIGCNNTILIQQPATIRLFGDNNKISVVKNGQLIRLSGKGDKNRLMNRGDIAILSGEFSVDYEEGSNTSSVKGSGNIVIENSVRSSIKIH